MFQSNESMGQSLSLEKPMSHHFSSSYVVCGDMKAEVFLYHRHTTRKAQYTYKCKANNSYDLLRHSQDMDIASLCDTDAWQISKEHKAFISKLSMITKAVLTL